VRKQIFDLAGEGQRNADGSSRQGELRRCAPGDPIILKREPQNDFDANAVAVMSERGVCIGYVCREEAEKLAAAIDRGGSHRAQIHELRGGVPDYPSYGCRICVVFGDGRMRAAVPLAADQLVYRRAAASGCLGALLALLVGVPLLIATTVWT